MVLQEFTYLKEKAEKLSKGLKKLNKKRAEHKGKEDFCDDGIKPDCKCDWKGNCEDICKNSNSSATIEINYTKQRLSHKFIKL